jgi:hypothetical protein
LHFFCDLESNLFRGKIKTFYLQAFVEIIVLFYIVLLISVLLLL